MKLHVTFEVDREHAEALCDVLNDDNGIRNYIAEVMLKQVRPDEVGKYVRGVTALGEFARQLAFQLRRRARKYDFAALFDEAKEQAAKRGRAPRNG